jgi:hypothetical protein
LGTAAIRGVSPKHRDDDEGRLVVIGFSGKRKWKG